MSATRNPPGPPCNEVETPASCTRSHTIVLADGLIGVSRVIISLLRQRRYVLRSCIGELARDRMMMLTVVVASETESDTALLERRLRRIPSVLEVHTTPADIEFLSYRESRGTSGRAEPTAPRRDRGAGRGELK